jgi:hypothetical protein
MLGNRSLLGLGKKALSDPESKVLVIWGGLAFVVAYGANFFSAFFPTEFLDQIPAMKEWMGKTKYSEEAAVLLSFMWLSLPFVTLAQLFTMDWYRYLPVTLKKLAAYILICLIVYMGLIHGLGTDIEGYRPSGFISRLYHGSKPGMIMIIWSLFSATAFSIGLPIVWLLGKSRKEVEEAR